MQNNPVSLCRDIDMIHIVFNEIGKGFDKNLNNNKTLNICLFNVNIDNYLQRESALLS